jgi:DNA-binding NarL/FixJ family response regulator
VVVEGIRSALSAEEGIELAGIANDGKEALKAVERLRPHIVVTDISMPGMNGVEAAHEIQRIRPNTRIIVFSMYADKEYVVSLFRAGISGYVLKEEPISELIRAVRSVMNGGTYFTAGIQEIIQDHMRELELGPNAKDVHEIQNGIAKLSAREKEVFPLLADGVGIRDIADRLCISRKTVETHKYNIMAKLGAQSVADLTKTAIKKHLIEL